jgi:hypothetical protein
VLAVNLKAAGVLTAVLSFSCGLPTRAQEAHQLAVTDVVRVPSVHSQEGLSVKSPVKCSPIGELYVQLVGGGAEPGVTMVSADRKSISFFGLESVPDLQQGTLLDYAPGASHDVFLLVSKSTGARGPFEYYIVRLREGASSLVIRLEIKPGFQLRQLAVLGDDAFVIAGFFGWQNQHVEPFTAIFKNDGQFLRKITLDGDLNAEGQSPDVKGKSTPTGKSESETSRMSLFELSSLQTADDGSVYLARHAANGPLFVITPGGAVKRIALRSPAEGAELSSVKLCSGKVVADYFVRDSSAGYHQHFLRVFDLSTGQVSDVTYKGSEFGVGLVCYRNEVFEFLAYGSDKHLRIVSAVSR